MKPTLIYSLVLLCSAAQPALAQQFESDEAFEQQAAKQLHATPVKQTAKRATTQAKPRATQQGMGNFSQPAPRTGFGASYGFRPQRNTLRSSYGYRPQRDQLLPAGYSREMLQAKMQKLQAMQQMMGAAGGAGAMGGGMPGMGGGMGMGAGGGMQQGQGKPNFLQMLMGGGGGGGGMGMPQQQPQMQGQPQFDRREMMKQFFGGGGSTEQSGE